VSESRLAFIEDAGFTEWVNKRRKRLAKYICSCGKEVVKVKESVKSGYIVSCGCLKKENAVKLKLSHGKRRTATYRSWAALKTRCTNTKIESYKNYGGRGIKVCGRWLDSFENFLEDMGDRPEGTSLDRADNDKGYSKENCRWATPKEQARNTSRNRFLTLYGVNQTMAAWTETLEIPTGVISQRLNRSGWSVEKALTTPVKR
jgi:hypothetical protein